MVTRFVSFGENEDEVAAKKMTKLAAEESEYVGLVNASRGYVAFKGPKK